MDHPCFCNSGLSEDACCNKKYPSIKVKSDLNGDSSTYDLWSIERRWVCVALTKLFHKSPVLQNRNIIIFGAGECTDLPMDYICSTFSEVVLVDIDSDALERSKQNIPEGLQDKVVWIKWDVTGLFDKIQGKFKRDLLKGRYKSIDDALTFFRDINRSIPEIKLPRDIEDRMPFAVTVSDLMVSQLFCPFYFSDIYPLFKGIDEKAHYQPTKYDDLNDFSNWLNYQHLKLLHKVSEKETGKILILADTFLVGKLTDGSDAELNKIVMQNPKYLDRQNIGMREIAEWMNDYCLTGSNILYPMRKYNYNKFQIEGLMWWWWHFSDIKSYLVIAHLLTPSGSDVKPLEG